MYTIAKFKTLNLSLALILLLLASANLTANTLKDISFSALPGNKAEIILKLDEPISKPSSFSTDNPARIAIDLDNTSSQIGKQAQNIGIGMARSITAIEAGDKTRVVINLVSAVGHTISTEGNEILVIVGAGSGSAASTPSKQALATSSKVLGKANNSITSIDFNRGEKGKAEIILGISNPEAIVDMRTEGGQLVLEVIDSDVDASLARKLDVSDFATPVLSIETRPSGNNVKVKIEATGDYDHLAYQLDDSYVLEVRPKTKEELEKERREKKIYTGERLSLNFQDIEVRSVLQLLADFTGLNMVVSDNVSGNVTLRLKNVPWDQAMDIILRTKGLGMRQNENVVYIAPAQEITTWEKNELEARREIEELAPLRTELIQINYASASDIAALLSSRQGSDNNETEDELKLLSSRGTVTVDERTNSILVQDTAEKLKEMRDLIAQIDIPVKQVMILICVALTSP